MNTNIVLKWIYTFIIPILIASLSFIPLDFITSIFWLIAFFYIVVIGIKLLAKLYKVLIDKEKNKLILAYTLKFILSIIAFIFATKMIHMSITSANEKALQLAINMKKYVLKNNQCDVIGKDTIMYGNYGTKYPISYICDSKKKRFEYRVRINHDDDFKIEYLNDGKLKLTSGHKSGLKSLYFNENSNLHELAKNYN